MRSVGPPHEGKDSSRANLAEQVYAEIKARMHDFRLVPGDRFSEAELGVQPVSYTHLTLPTSDLV